MFVDVIRQLLLMLHIIYNVTSSTANDATQKCNLVPTL